LQKKIEDGVSSVDTLLNSINYIMDEKTNNSLKNSILKFNNTIDQLSSTSEEINKLIKTNSDEFTNTMNNLSEMSGKFNSISDSLSKIEFNKIVKDLETSLAQVKSITSKIDRGEGSLGKLINDENMYTNLENATKQMEELLQDMKLNPKRYVHFSVFGKKNREYQEAEDNEE
jgi:phospholipid/cholesterol/gamma-HCH transport system substrate-binding protein